MVMQDNFTGSIMAASAVNLTLKNAIPSPHSLKQVMPVARVDKGLVIAEGRLKISTGRRYDIALDSIYATMTLESFTRSVQTAGPLITEMKDGVEVIVNNSAEIAALFSALRVARRINQVAPVAISDFEADLAYARQVASDLNIQIGWDHPFACSEASWTPIMKELPAGKTFKIWDKSGVLKCQFILVFCSASSSYSVIPVTLFRCLDFNNEIIGFTPPKPPYAFLNEHLLSHYNTATVVLTPNVQRALQSPANANYLYLANLGYEAWLDGFDYSILRDRRLIVVDEDGLYPEYTLQLLARLKQNGINAEVEYKYPNHTIKQVS